MWRRGREGGRKGKREGERKRKRREGREEEEEEEKGQRGCIYFVDNTNASHKQAGVMQT